MKVQIYTLSHPITNEIRYVGRTIRKLSDRLYQHIYNCNKSHHHNSNWINGLIKNGLKPKIDLLEICDENNWDMLEQYWISQFKAWGIRLTNDCAGGRGNLRPSLETRQKISEAIQKPVIQYSFCGDFVAEYKSIVEASKKTKISGSYINRSASGQIFSSRTFIWKFKTCDNYLKKINVNSSLHNKKVYQYDLNGEFIEEFVNTKIAALKTNSCRSSIIDCCNGKLKSANSFIWNYKKNDSLRLVYSKKLTNKKVCQFNKCHEFIADYESIKNASQNTGVDKNNISACCSGKLKSAGGYIWKYK